MTIGPNRCREARETGEKERTEEAEAQAGHEGSRRRTRDRVADHERGFSWADVNQAPIRDGRQRLSARSPVRRVFGGRLHCGGLPPGRLSEKQFNRSAFPASPPGGRKRE